MNKFILKGYIGNIESERTYTKVSIATTRSYKNDKGEYETDWFNAVAFGGTADFISKYFSKGAAKLAPYLTKGKMVAVSGSLEQESWEKNSQKFSKLTVNVSTLQQLHWDKNNSSSPQNVTADNSPESFPCF